MSLTGLQERLAALQESTGQLKELVDRLAHLTFEPGSLVVDDDDGDNDFSVGDELSVDIVQILKAGVEDQELLLQEAGYLRPEGHEKARLVEGVVRLGNELLQLRLAFRKARLHARRNLVEAQKLERQLILKSYSSPLLQVDPLADEKTETAPPQQQQHQQKQQQQQHQRHHSHHSHQPRSIHQNRSGLSDKDQQAVGASSNVTNALRRTHDLMVAELGRSEFAHQTLEESSAALQQLDQAYGSLGSMLTRSRDLLGTLLRSQKSDTWYLQTALYMLSVTLAWLVFRRLLYGPVWWLVLLPLRVLFGLGSAATTRVLLPAGRSVWSGSFRVHEAAGESRADDDGADKDQLLGRADSMAQVGGGGEDGAAAAASRDQVQSAVDDAIREAVRMAAATEEAQSSGLEKEPIEGRRAAQEKDEL